MTRALTRKSLELNGEGDIYSSGNEESTNETREEVTQDDLDFSKDDVNICLQYISLNHY